MKLLLEFLPLILFFIAFKLQIVLVSTDGGFQFQAAGNAGQGIYFATAVAIVASVVQMSWYYLRRKPISSMQWLSLGIILVFGGATLVLQDDRFIRWKPTALYWSFAGALLVGRVFFGANWLKKLMASLEISLPEAVWTRLTWAWIVFFAAMGCLNLYVSSHYTIDTWVNFKVWWSMGLILAFSLAQGAYMARHMPADDQPAEPPRAS